MGACRSGANRTSLREDCGGLHGAASRPRKAAAVDLQGALHPIGVPHPLAGGRPVRLFHPEGGAMPVEACFK